ncbi:hypothetical protein M758_3G101500 [Ceratodon purpureus]|nr:hypothetical protein M758_3G101500 [Ceratodon purpureus]
MFRLCIGVRNSGLCCRYVRGTGVLSLEYSRIGTR